VKPPLVFAGGRCGVVLKATAIFAFKTTFRFMETKDLSSKVKTVAGERFGALVLTTRHGPGLAKDFGKILR
jgi:hypothetical protein